MLKDRFELEKHRTNLRTETVAGVTTFLTMIGALLGTSTTTSYVESAAGIEQGGRTGLTSVVTGTLFLLAMFFVPELSDQHGPGAGIRVVRRFEGRSGPIPGGSWSDVADRRPVAGVSGHPLVAGGIGTVL